jgi:Domain of unknown function (DUF4350)
MTPLQHNRLTAAVATGLFVVLAVLLASFSSHQASDALQRRPSTFFTDRSGARALLLVMQKLLPSAEIWRRPLNLLPLPAAGEPAPTLIVAGPGKALAASEAEHLGRWLDAGGQLILLNSNGWPLRTARAGNETKEDESEDDDGEMQSETFLSRYAPGLRWSKAGEFRTVPGSGASLPAGDLTLRQRQSFAATDNAEVIATAGKVPVAVALPVGRGRIVAVADPTMVSNGALRRSDNAVWLVSLPAGWGSGAVLFDEYHHGFGEKRSAGALTRAFLKTPWGWMILQLTGAGLLYIFLFRRRFGRISEPPLPSRASPLELVQARGGFLEAAQARRLAAELIVQEVCRSRLKNRRKLSESADLSEALAICAPSGDSRAAATLGALFVKTQHDQRLTDREFIELGSAAGELTKGSTS